jgi:hypothetical protein
MSNLVLPAVSAGIGYMIGGPTGAQVGWMIGSSVQAGRQTIEQEAVGDLRIQTAQYGIPIPFVIGMQRVAGNVIWASEKRTYDIKTKSSGKGGGPTVVTKGYRQDLAILICQGPIVGISRVWANNKLIIDGRVTAKPLVGDLYLGTSSQMPDVTIEAKEGVGNVPAFRGIAYIVLKDYDLGTSGALPNFSFEVVGKQGF